MEQEIENILVKHACEFNLTGSKEICSPPPVGTDTDYLVYCAKSADQTEGLISELMELGFVAEGDQEHYEKLVESSFVSLRKNELNLIVSNQIWFVKRHRLATHICKTLNLLNKADRIMVFKGVLYGTLEPNKKHLEAA